ncbi:hypothetical protein [Dysgonomonas sp. ZJ279]|uniref:hypothetical protein n=1 Tax=Dysgonomonas sp. ZJ279 TaxID=2709796 RepID=UPI0013ECA152|nr:hypothetical protein [Dysgonomonas sp. ZJ279]
MAKLKKVAENVTQVEQSVPGDQEKENFIPDPAETGTEPEEVVAEKLPSILDQLLDNQEETASKKVTNDESLSKEIDLKAQAKEHMEAQSLKEIWRCPNTGYWFSRKDYAEDYERKNKCSLEHYKK